MTAGEKKTVGLCAFLLFLVFAMVTLGGFVRLTGSGLSIPEWPFFTVDVRELPDGSLKKVRTVFAPMSEEQWETTRATFVKLVPGFEEGIGIAAFKRMFWIEWSHRALASVIFISYITFMVVALRAREVRAVIGKRAVGGFFLLLSQAVVGGILVWLHLPAFKLAIHLSIAFLFAALILWMMLRVWRAPAPVAERRGPNPILPLSIAVFLIVLAQVFSGGLMAGSHAGFMLNTWPMMGDYWVPPGLMAEDVGFVKNFVENKILIQFFHRWFAIFTLVAVLYLVLRSLTVKVSPVARWALRAVASVAVLQVVVGIITLLTGVHTHIALTHQSLGLVLLLNVLVVVYETAAHPVLAEKALMAENDAKVATAAASGETVNA